jgi:hypothetical protein
MRFLLGLSIINTRYRIGQVKAYLMVADNKNNLLHNSLNERKGKRLKRDASWLSEAEMLLQPVRTLDDIPREEWKEVAKTHKDWTVVIITCRRECREPIGLSNDMEIRALMHENFSPWTPSYTLTDPW